MVLHVLYVVAGLPAVVTLAVYGPDMTTDDVPIPEACRRLEEAGAAVVGLNCARGPETMIPLLREIRKVCKVRIQMYEIEPDNGFVVM